jgi:hypothetical protein
MYYEKVKLNIVVIAFICMGANRAMPTTIKILKLVNALPVGVVFVGCFTVLARQPIGALETVLIARWVIEAKHLETVFIEGGGPPVVVLPLIDKVLNQTLVEGIHTRHQWHFIFDIAKEEVNPSVGPAVAFDLNRHPHTLVVCPVVFNGIEKV